MAEQKMSDNVKMTSNCWKGQHENPWNFHQTCSSSHQNTGTTCLQQLGFDKVAVVFMKPLSLRWRFSNLPRINYHTQVGDCTHHFVYALGPFSTILTCKPSYRTPHLIVIRILRLARTLDFVTQSCSSSHNPSDYDLVPGEQFTLRKRGLLALLVIAKDFEYRRDPAT